MKITQSNYCKCGLGVGSPECHEEVEVKTERNLLGGPGVSDAMTEVLNEGIAPGELGLIILNSVNSKESLSKFLQDQGFKRGSDEFWKYYKTYSENYKSECEYLNT